MSYLSIGLFVFGGYMVTLDILKIPTLKTSKNILSFYKKDIKKSKIEIFLDDLSSKIAGSIKINNRKYKELEVKLQNLEIYTLPENYLASNYIKASIPIVLGIPLYFINPITIPIMIILAIYINYNNSKQLDKDIQVIREKIEYELPRFTRDITEYLKSDRNILLMLERYKETAGEHLKRELEITIRDMKTGNYEIALTRLETRLQSPMMSSVVRGLISVIRGDDAGIYFEILSKDFKELELERLKAEAIKKPGKIKKYSLILLTCMILMWTIVIVLSLIENSKGMF